MRRVNRQQRLFILPAGTGFTCLGFRVCRDRAKALAVEMGWPYVPERLGSLKSLAQYQALVAEAQRRNVATGFRSTTELTPQLVGLEGRRVEVLDRDGETRRFRVGKSTGWIPCHLECVPDVSGGMATYGTPYKSVRVVG